MNNDNTLIAWVFVIAFMAIWAVVGFFIIRWGVRAMRFGKKITRTINTASVYPQMGNALVRPRKAQHTMHLSDGEVREVKTFLQRRRQQPQHIVEVREYDV